MAHENIHRLFDIPGHQLRMYPRKDALCKRKSNGKWDTFSSGEFVRHVNQMSCGLLELGLKKGDHAATFSYNQPEWNFADLGMLQIGVVHVALFPTLGDNELIYTLNDAGVRVIFVETEEMTRQILNLRTKVPDLKYIFTFEKVSLEGVQHWSSLLRDDKKLQSRIEKIKKSIGPDDLATLVYTPGTSGDFRGVMLTHTNILSNIKACMKVMPVTQTHRALSFLPLSHMFERMVSYLYMYAGAGVYYAQNTGTIPRDIQEVRPHFFTTVPRLLEKVYDKIYKKGMAQPGPIRLLFKKAIELALQYEHTGKSLHYHMKLRLADKFVFSKWREALGGKVIGIVCGGAALQPRLARVFWAAGIPVAEGYGLTETSPVITVNHLNSDQCKFGTVGRPLERVEVKIAADSEILVRGPNIMKGYFNKPDETAAVFDMDGFFHTGDLGVMSEDGFLRITGVKKEMFKTSGGKYIVPQKIENRLLESPFIDQVMVVGENRKYPAALIVPDFTQLKKWCANNNILADRSEELVSDNRVMARFRQEIERYNRDFSKYEQLKKFVLLPEKWSVENGLLSHSQKLNRKLAIEKFSDYINSLYDEPEETKEAVPANRIHIPEQLQNTRSKLIIAAFCTTVIAVVFTVQMKHLNRLHR